MIEDIESIIEDVTSLQKSQIIRFNIYNYNDLKTRDVLKVIYNLKLRTGYKYLIYVTRDNKYAMNYNTINRIAQILEDQLTYENANQSDQILIDLFDNNDPIFSIQLLDYEDKIKEVEEDGKIIKKKVRRNKLNENNFFNYHLNNDIKLDLIKYQVYNIYNDEYNENCFIYTLLKSGFINEELINSIKLMIRVRDVPTRVIKEIAIKYKLNIVIKTDEKKIHKYLYNENKELNIIKIGCVNNHCFLNEITKYTKKNICEILNLNNKYMFLSYKNDNDLINSYDLINYLFKNKDRFLTKISVNNINILQSQYFNKLEKDSEINNLKYNDTDIKLIESKEDKDNSNYEKVWFDFETNLKKDEQNKLFHKPYLCCSIDEKNNIKSFIGENCGLSFLCSLKKDTLLIAHNSNYDIRFLIKYIITTNVIEKSGKVISFDGIFNGIKIKVKDSLLLINMPLRDFGKTFNLEQEKEVMPYDLYNDEELFKQRIIKIEDAVKYIKENEKEQFLNNINKWKLNVCNKFDIIKYSQKYCEIDCKVLKEGYEIFRQWFLEGTNIDIDNKLTLASVGYTYAINEGVFDGLYSLSGTPSLFISKAVRGGRVMTNKNEKIKCNKILNDFDAVSLYPSAMERLGGLLKGKPKVLKTTDYNIIQNFDGYFVEIIIKSISKIRDFPLLSTLDIKTGSKNYTNDIIGHKFIVDKIFLEDLIRFHGITFEIIRGYYFDEGKNDNISKTIRYLFNKRLEMKKTENPAQLIYKELMNSIYGKTILKPIDSEIKIINNKDSKKIETNDYIVRNYDWIKSIEEIPDSNKTKIHLFKAINQHFNVPQVGVEILSMSKRIMNEVMTLAEDNDIKIYYQDTDSMHIEDDNVKKLGNLFRDKYRRELIGKDMGQFHCDFDLKGARNIVSKGFIGLGKKSYIDILEGIDENGNIVNDYHIRMKGIPIKSIKHYCKINNIEPFTLYENLLEGKNVEFDLLAGGEVCKFKMNKNYTIESLNQFKRNVKF
jgi:hypothetical protein